MSRDLRRNSEPDHPDHGPLTRRERIENLILILFVAVLSWLLVYWLLTN